MGLTVGFGWLYALVQPDGAWAQPVGLVAVAAVVAGVLLATTVAARRTAARRPAAGGSTEIRYAAARERARRTGVARHRDPDARGRRRPRAPSGGLSAA